ncbi:nickel/cobalt efflux protein RcnA [Erwinia sp. OLTSP20]|uniref:HoxN/HupN/NixA family nickel/cobalt transporter n=1 Tax=unclassified Erwinia TaxID=2622719 RepID=UPI000C1745C5|nr:MULTISPECIES: sulfite exporter TauE/SafE family protein [unclassified Erwinia]PIJ50326.1 nickel/cobalt efflux protein RcnA [Erwinia sp. OAMSP11]PIJ72163.1 nickel/cobalt efflux protein RcnA [Erwinia sp. OLSSP12]PIJ81454.1 nickel/cobalt efflux protein RcnA [Erwinia sp. OLCASP19]PIJ84160.1 nickel/cobalt efflux protein RcnA [Erwinia sp. OLMTSP26]PIJ85859.1 nickel/cobalt efflux protein RcnA [Erwinia sp. OLMDSP33]
MFDFATFIQHSNAWLYLPGAILLGALHGLEPGHSKTMMAAFIVAIRGSVRQAILLGVAATLSHTLVVWLVALAGTWLSTRFTVAAAEPWLTLVSALIIVVIAGWIACQNWRQQQMRRQPLTTDTPLCVVDTGHGRVEVSLVQQQGEKRWQLRTRSGRRWQANEVTIAAASGGGFAPLFQFRMVDGVLHSTQAVTSVQPPAGARLMLSHGGHSHEYDLRFARPDGEAGPLPDAHQQAHARQIKKRFSGQAVTHGQIILFGLTGGLIPCPAAVTVLLLCLQMKALVVGCALVLCFSLGLALTLVAVGVAAALSINQLAQRWDGFDALARRAPWFSVALMLAMAGMMAYHGWQGLHP